METSKYETKVSSPDIINGIGCDVTELMSEGKSKNSISKPDMVEKNSKIEVD